MPKTKRAHRGKVTQYPDMEKELLDWVCSMHKKKQWILVYSDNAKNSAACINVDEQCFVIQGINWLDAKLMKRHGLALHQKAKIAQKLPDDSDNKIVSFHSFVLNL